MISSLQTCKTSLLKAGLITACASLLTVFAPAALHASPITYNLILTATTGSPAFSGTGTIVLDSAAPTSGLSQAYKLGSGLEDLTFTIGGQTFDLAHATSPSTTLVQFLNGSIYDITFAEQLGTTPNRYSLMTTSGYVFSYADLSKNSTGTFTVSLAPSTSPVPEPGSLALLGTGLIGGAGTLFRRFSVRRAS
ncbi:MAG TPA: PEP-CTERM sorting domain-containing protein [Edaphobacter sp.]|nr:PEP-CTERM sorting domain-containing protein [Edaphobacter sp.]